MADEGKDKWVDLVNPDGVQERVWDYPGHADRLLTVGWTIPVPVPVGKNLAATTKSEKEN